MATTGYKSLVTMGPNLSQWGIKGVANGEFQGPSGLSIDSNDNIHMLLIRIITEFKCLQVTVNTLHNLAVKVLVRDNY